jgi:hypothetical protein
VGYICTFISVFSLSLCLTLCLFVCQTEIEFGFMSGHARDPVSVSKANPPFARATLSASLGYFIYDFGLVLLNYESMGGIDTVLHHIIAMGSFSIGMTWEGGRF